MELINNQEEKINALTTRVSFLEQAMQDSQMSTIIPSNISELLSKKNGMTQALFQKFMLNDFWFQFYKDKSSETTAGTTNSVKDILINQMQVYLDELNLELDKIHRLSLNSIKAHHKKTVPNVICCFKNHSFKEKLYAKRKMIFEKIKQSMNFHVSLTKE